MPGIGRKFGASIGAWRKTASFSHDAEWAGPMIVEDAHRVFELRRGVSGQTRPLLTDVIDI